MPIPIKCPRCRKPGQARDEAAGQLVVCPVCGQKVQIPDPTTVPPESTTPGGTPFLPLMAFGFAAAGLLTVLTVSGLFMGLKPRPRQQEAARAVATTTVEPRPVPEPKPEDVQFVPLVRKAPALDERKPEPPAVEPKKAPAEQKPPPAPDARPAAKRPAPPKFDPDEEPVEVALAVILRILATDFDDGVRRYHSRRLIVYVRPGRVEPSPQGPMMVFAHSGKFTCYLPAEPGGDLRRWDRGEDMPILCDFSIEGDDYPYHLRLGNWKVVRDFGEYRRVPDALVKAYEAIEPTATLMTRSTGGKQYTSLLALHKNKPIEIFGVAGSHGVNPFGLPWLEVVLPERDRVRCYFDAKLVEEVQLMSRSGWPVRVRGMVGAGGLTGCGLAYDRGGAPPRPP